MQTNLNNVVLLKTFERIISRQHKGTAAEFTSNDHFKKLCELQPNQVSVPHILWTYKDKKVLVDGRFAEFRYKLANNLPISVEEKSFKNISEARRFMITTLLSQPNLSNGCKLLAANALRNDLRKLAKKQQGLRFDLKQSERAEFKPLHTNLEVAKLVNIGQQTVSRFFNILEQGSSYFGKAETEKHIDDICSGQQTVNAVYRWLREKKGIQKAIAKYAKKHNFIPPIEESEVTDDSQNIEKEDVYVNPSDLNGFENKIVCGDYKTELKKLPNGFCSLILTSPPYNVDNVDYDIPCPRMPYAEYLKDLEPFFVESSRILKDGGRLVINIADVNTYGKDSEQMLTTPIVADIVQMVRNLNVGLKYRATIIWNKRCAYSKFHLGIPSPSNPILKTNHEYLIVFSKGSWELKPSVENAPSDLTMAEYLKWSTTVWDIVPASKCKLDHPCPYPEQFVERVLKLFSFVGDTVVDCFLGTGSLTAVAARLGRKWYGCDISAKYCKQAAERTAKAYKEFCKKASEEPIDDVFAEAA
jgi:DNA modification methylase